MLLITRQLGSFITIINEQNTLVRIATGCLVLAFFFTTAFSSTPSGGASWTFENINRDHGLSHSVVNCIYEDQQGFLWVGSKDGLNRYDGFGFQVYRANQGLDAEGIYSGEVKSIYQDSDQKLWIRHSGFGLSTYDPQREAFSVFLHSDSDSTTITSNSIFFFAFQSRCSS
ncbi:MAG: hypothetical protein HC842_07340 [Cytophagales bacterium]|nr:hypothetical protein [Cytophagales bacterium]